MVFAEYQGIPEQLDESIHLQIIDQQRVQAVTVFTVLTTECEH